MSEFDEWMGKKCSVIQSAYGEEYIAAQEAWDFQQAKIDNLKAQLNNMEACYIEKKKQVEAVSQVHAELEALKAEDERNWVGFER